MGDSKIAAHGEMIESFRQWFSEGDKTVLLDALRICLEEGYKLPDWVRDGFLAAYAAVDNGTARSWDEVFGPARARSKGGKQWRLAHQVLREVVLAEQSGTPIDVGLFEMIGKKLGVGASTASSHYYRRIGRHRPKKRNSKNPR